MKKLIIVSTKPDGGVGGGIPSALIGYMDGLHEQEVSFEVVESHHENKNVITSWFIAFFKIFYLSIKYRKSAVFWFHCGPWLSMFRKFTLALSPLIFGSLTIAHIHSPTYSNYLTKNRFSNFLVKLGLFPFKKVFVLTSWWKELLIANNIRQEIIISPNPCNKRYCELAHLALNREFISREATSFQILTMARLIKGKGVEHVIRAMAILPEKFVLIIAGDGPLKAELEQLVRQLSIEKRVSFVGWVNGDQKEKLLTESNLFCLPSTYDSFGMVFIEAMSFNLPVIANGWGPINDVVTPDVGICCKEPTAKLVAEAILNIEKNIGKYFGKGPNKILKSYTPEIVVKNIIPFL